MQNASQNDNVRLWTKPTWTRGQLSKWLRAVWLVTLEPEHRGRCTCLITCFSASGPGGWGAGNRLDYSYDHFLDVVQDTPTSVGKARSARIKRTVPLSDPKIQLIFNITGKDKLSICWIIWGEVWRASSEICSAWCLLGTNPGKN